MQESLNWFFHQLYLVLGILSLIGAFAAAYALLRILIGNWRLARYERERIAEQRARPPLPSEPPETPEEKARRHAEFLAAGWTYEPGYGAYTKPARPDWER